jgi:hypothetical protein
VDPIFGKWLNLSDYFNKILRIATFQPFQLADKKETIPAVVTIPEIFDFIAVICLTEIDAA